MVAKFRRTAKMRISKFDALLPNDDGMKMVTVVNIKPDY